MTTRVIGLGQAVAGDDGVGHAVIDALSSLDLSSNVELERVREASALLPLLEGAERVVVVDAVVGAGPPGQVHVLSAADLEAAPMSSVSSHGMGVLQTLELARALMPTLPDVRFVAVSIAAPTAYGLGLSDEVGGAIKKAVQAIETLLKGS